jgi:Taurine catabolism dioxygenase TauD, TfdA family
MDDLADLAKTAGQTGWAVGSVPLWKLRSGALALGWEEVATRKGDGPVSVLRPTPAEEAHPRSLSAIHGMGEQPLHTDGAHLKEPPTFVVLHAAQPNGTPTLLWSEASNVTNTEHPFTRRPLCLVGGIFAVRNGSTQFLASAFDDRGGYRYDPGCMTPADERAHESARHFASLAAAAHRHEWTEPDQVLVINNRRTLHARAAVDAADADRELTRIAYRVAPKR